MARRHANIPLNVFLNGQAVGVLRREASGAISFHYSSDWLAWESAFPVSLSLPLREDRYIGAPVINVFDNLLPDSEAIRKRVAERVSAAGTDAYSLLTALGRDCVGALQFLPDGCDPGAAGSVDGNPVSDADITGIIRNLASAPLGMGEDDGFSDIDSRRAGKNRAAAQRRSMVQAVGHDGDNCISSSRRSGSCQTASTSRTASRTNIYCLKLLQALRRAERRRRDC